MKQRKIVFVLIDNICQFLLDLVRTPFLGMQYAQIQDRSSGNTLMVHSSHPYKIYFDVFIPCRLWMQTLFFYRISCEYQAYNSGSARGTQREPLIEVNWHINFSKEVAKVIFLCFLIDFSGLHALGREVCTWMLGALACNLVAVCPALHVCQI